METKRCKKCLKTKNLEEFSNHKTTRDRKQTKCKECMNKHSHAHYLKNRAKYIEKSRNRYQETKKERKEYCVEYRKNNKDKIKEAKKKYVNKNREKIRSYIKKYNTKRRKEDTLFKMTNNIRCLVTGSFRRQNSNGFTKCKKTEEILGCSIEKFVSYIVEQFEPGMTLENHGEWHLDHIIPLATAETNDDIIRLNHYTNFQPLWAKDNLIKGARIL